MSKNKTKECKNCDKDISHMHHRCLRCPPCQKLHKKEYFRQYMAKYTLKKRIERYNQRSLDDAFLLSQNHMTGLGTFDLPEYDGDFEKEYKNIQSLKKRFLR